jgi:GIY-YIG catalytic domain
MFYYLYEIKNLINGKIYVGVHKTADTNDGYMGSGKVIKQAIEKHGVENFRKTILEMFDDSAKMYAREKEIVTESFIARDDTYNLRIGGHGGFDYIIENGLHRSIHYRGKRLTEEHVEKRRATMKAKYDSGELDHVKEASRDRAVRNNPMHDPIVVEKVRMSLTGKQKTSEHKRQTSAAMLAFHAANPAARIAQSEYRRLHPVTTRPIQVIETCPHCSKVGKMSGMRRWHFDNCKTIQSPG